MSTGGITVRQRPARRLLARLVGLIALVGLCAVSHSAQPAEYPLAAVKAAFLYRFAAYVEWPTALPAEASFKIATVGADEVAEQLDKLLPGHLLQERPAQVIRLSRVSDLDGVQILYFGSGVSASSALMRAAVKRPILIVTDEAGGLAAGATINFIKADRNVRFEVSMVTAERSNLKIDSGLLSVATHVERAPRGGMFCVLTSAWQQNTWRCDSRFVTNFSATGLSRWRAPLRLPHPGKSCNLCG